LSALGFGVGFATTTGGLGFSGVETFAGTAGFVVERNGFFKSSSGLDGFFVVDAVDAVEGFVVVAGLVVVGLVVDAAVEGVLVAEAAAGFVEVDGFVVVAGFVLVEVVEVATGLDVVAGLATATFGGFGTTGAAGSADSSGFSTISATSTGTFSKPSWRSTLPFCAPMMRTPSWSPFSFETVALHATPSPAPYFPNS
jgi:hypothetical protein